MNEAAVSIDLPKNLFAGKIAVVTGASRGVGRATAIRLAEGGANVVVNYLSNDVEALETVRVCQNKGVESIAVQADVSDMVSAQTLAKQTLERFARSISSSATPVCGKGAPIEEMSEDVWNKVINTNLKSAWATTKACVPALKKQASGSIVMVSSTSGQRGEAGYSNYSASKGGMISFTKALASELCPKIRVNAVAPGWIETAMVRPCIRRRSILPERHSTPFPSNASPRPTTSLCPSAFFYPIGRVTSRARSSISTVAPCCAGEVFA
jgi:3-oxoacyl-[acyl-carrier protein] reductase